MKSYFWVRIGLGLLVLLAVTLTAFASDRFKADFDFPIDQNARVMMK